MKLCETPPLLPIIFPSPLAIFELFTFVKCGLCLVFMKQTSHICHMHTNSLSTVTKSCKARYSSSSCSLWYLNFLLHSCAHTAMRSLSFPYSKISLGFLTNPCVLFWPMFQVTEHILKSKVLSTSSIWSLCWFFYTRGSMSPYAYCALISLLISTLSWSVHDFCTKLLRFADATYEPKWWIIIWPHRCILDIFPIVLPYDCVITQSLFFTLFTEYRSLSWNLVIPLKIQKL